METVTPESTYDVYEYEHIYGQLMDAMGETSRNLNARNGEIVSATIGDEPAQFFIFESSDQTISEVRFTSPLEPREFESNKSNTPAPLKTCSQWLSLQFDHPVNGVASKRLSYLSFEGQGIAKAIAFNPSSELQYPSEACVDTLAFQLNDFLLNLKLIERV